MVECNGWKRAKLPAHNVTILTNTLESVVKWISIDFWKMTNQKTTFRARR
jgi:hypothetical protein